MKNKKLFKKLIIAAMAVCFAAVAAGCQKEEKLEQVSTENRMPVVYEAVFLDSQQVSDILLQIRGREEAPYPNVSRDYHVTLAYKPEQYARSLYGQEIEVKIVGYKLGTLIDEDGKKRITKG